MFAHTETNRYANVSTEILLTLVDIPNLLSKPAIVTELIARGADHRTVNSLINPGRRASDR